MVFMMLEMVLNIWFCLSTRRWSFIASTRSSNSEDVATAGQPAQGVKLGAKC